jgi:hypothetical protein
VQDSMNTSFITLSAAVSWIWAVDNVRNAVEIDTESSSGPPGRRGSLAGRGEGLAWAPPTRTQVQISDMSGNNCTQI